MRVDFKLRLQDQDSQDDTGTHRENLPQAENNKCHILPFTAD